MQKQHDVPVDEGAKVKKPTANDAAKAKAQAALDKIAAAEKAEQEKAEAKAAKKRQYDCDCCGCP